MSERRTLIVGDVHGCSDELDDLLERLRIHPKRDRVIFIGDLINKGPDSKGVYKTFRRLGAEAVLGNHEYAILQQASGQRPQGKAFRALHKAFGKRFDDFLEDLGAWPRFLDDEKLTVVHAGLVPGKPLDACTTEELVSIRTWDGYGDDLQNEANPPWFEYYHDPKLVVFGHWAALEGVIRKNVIGLDTGCVYGKMLTALVLPERKLVQVKARKTYVRIAG